MREITIVNFEGPSSRLSDLNEIQMTDEEDVDRKTVHFEDFMNHPEIEQKINQDLLIMRDCLDKEIQEFKQKTNSKNY